MKSKIVAVGRLIALGLLTLVSLPACGGGTLPASQNAGLLWNSTSGTAVGGGSGASQTLWVDPNSGLGGGQIGALIPSSDDITYDMPVVYIAGNNHPLMTSTSSQTILQAESLLMQAINAYRSQQLGGGLGGLGGFGGGGFQLPAQNSFLAGHDGLSRSARANCKHFSAYHPGPLDVVNPEGDRVNSGGVNPPGRLAKAKITTTSATELVVSGMGYSDYNGAAAYFTANFGSVLKDTQWTHIGAGYWKGGSQTYYWSLILAKTPSP
jgi:hypothetical protein